MVGLAQGVIRSITERHENCVGVKQPKILRIHCSTNAKSNVRQQWNADLADAADKNADSDPRVSAFSAPSAF